MPHSDEPDVPPAVKCARCGRVDCAGCAAPSEPVRDAPIPWEQASGSLHQRLWRTALVASTRPARTFGELPDGSVAPALAFAFAAETVAIGSLGALLAAGAWALSPELWWRLAETPIVVGSFFGLLALGIVAMVALHALWGVCLELGARSAESAAKFRHGARFGLYACGWDLLTSPAGVIQGFLARGPARAFGPIAEAVRVPRAALRAYAARCRKLSPEAQRRGERMSYLIGGSALLGLVAIAIAAAIWLASRIG